MQIEHLGCQWIQFHLVWAKTFEELCRIHHSSALALMPTQGNYAKGNLPVGELRQRFDISGKFVEWYAERHFSPAIRNIEQIVVNTNVSYFEAFARNGGSDRVYLEGAVRAFNLQSKTVKYLYNTITNSIELDASTVVGNATIMPSAEVEATLVGFSSKFVKIAPIGKTWRVNVSQLTYLTGHHSTYVNDEAGPQCTYFSSIIIDTNIMIEKPFCHWISKGYRVCSCQ